MNIRNLLICAVAATAASIASAEQTQQFNPPPDASITTRIPGSLDPDARVVGPSFEPMREPRDPCHVMVLTSTVERAAEHSSFARLANDRQPVVSCAPAAIARTAALEPPPVYLAPPPPPAPVYVEPVRVAAPPPEELPHTASLIPLVGLLGLLALGGSAFLRVSRHLAS